MVEPTGYTALDMIGFTDKGQYDPLENYVKNDIVHDADEKMWLCKVDDTRGVTPAEGVSWTKYIAPPVANPETIGIGYGTCSTAASTTAKEVTLSGYNLKQNGYVSVLFTYAVPASATLNVNSKGAKPIYYHGSAITADIIGAGDLATFVYDGTNYNFVGVDNVSSQIQALANKTYATDDIAETDIADGDYFPFYDSSATTKRKTLWSNIRSVLERLFAKKDELTNISIVGTKNSTSSDISAGKFLYLNGELIRIIAKVSVGSTFIVNDNYVKVTEGGLNSIDSDFRPTAYEAPTNLHSGVTLDRGGFYKIGRIVIINCKFSISTSVGVDVNIAKFPYPLINSSFISVVNNKLQDMYISASGYLCTSTSGGTGTGTLIVTTVYVAGY